MSTLKVLLSLLNAGWTPILNGKPPYLGIYASYWFCTKGTSPGAAAELLLRADAHAFHFSTRTATCFASGVRPISE